MTNGNNFAFPSPPGANSAQWLGLTKREYFAAMAMQGMLSDVPANGQETVSAFAVQYADALIEALNAGEKK